MDCMHYYRADNRVQRRRRTDTDSRKCDSQASQNTSRCWRTDYSSSDTLQCVHSTRIHDITRTALTQDCFSQLHTRSSATAEKQRVSCACLPRLANWSCNAQNTAESSQRLYYFWHSNALIQEVLAENAFCHEIAAQGHSFCNRLPVI